MINLYQILNIDFQASTQSIQTGIALYRLKPNANEKVVQAARTYLLNPQNRAAYDRQLFTHLGIDKPTATVATSTKHTNTYQIEKKLIPTTQLNEFEHLYQFLGVSHTASHEDIKIAIDEAVLEGLNGKHIQEAREHLLNPDTRAAYNAAHQLENVVDDYEPMPDNDQTSKRWEWPKHWWSPFKKHASTDKVTHATAQTITSHNESIPSHTPTLATDHAQSNNHVVSEIATTQTKTPTATINRDNGYRFLGIRGNASYQEIKIAIRKARLKGRDKAQIDHLQATLLKPEKRRLYDKQNNISLYIAAHTGNMKSRVKATDYRMPALWFNVSLQKILLAISAILGFITTLLPWGMHPQGVSSVVTWPFISTCVFTLLMVFFGHKQDPLSQKAMVRLSLSLIIAALPWAFATPLFADPWARFGHGFFYTITAAIALLLSAWIFSAQSRNVSYQSGNQKLLGFLALFTNLALVIYIAYEAYNFYKQYQQFF